jgi:hypothetical protein
MRDAVSGSWPLLAAVERQDVTLARLLIDHGARPVTCQKRKRTELHALAEVQRGPFPLQTVQRLVLLQMMT